MAAAFPPSVRALRQPARGIGFRPRGRSARARRDASVTSVNDRFIGVHFPNAGTFDILWESLEIIDQEYLKEMAEGEKERMEFMSSQKMA